MSRLSATAPVRATGRKVWAYVAVALVAVSVGFGLGSKAQPTNRPTRTEVAQLAKVQAEAPQLSCWLEWNEEQQGHEVLCAKLPASKGKDAQAAR